MNWTRRTLRNGEQAVSLLSFSSMTPERYQLINALADTVLELPTDERARFLDASCAGDPELRMRVDRLLAAHESSTVLLEAPALEVLARDMATTPTDNDLTGKAVDGYRVISRLGAGGHGEVWLARDEQLRRDVALKLLSRRFTGDPHHVRQRFQQEARTASTLNHPNIVTIYEIGNTEGLDFIAQEFVQGQTLRQWLANGPVALLSIVDVGLQVAAALTAAHGAGIIHRDIKPENIMVRPDGLVKVLDFGLARFVEREPLDHEGAFSEEPITRPGFVLGTARYMSPEQARGLTVDPRSDLFSLGVVLYEMVTGIAPFSGPTPGDVLAAILTHQPPPLSQYSPETPPELERIIRRGLEKDPQARYPGANELRRDLNHLRRQIGFPDEPTPSSDEVAALTSHPSEKTPSSAQEVAGIRKSRAAFLITLCSIAAVLVALGIFKASRHGTTPSFSSMKINRVITRGDVADAAISTDGRYIAYVLNDERGQSLWITQRATGSDVRTIAPEPGQYTGLTFSPDGNYLYYRRKVGNGIFTLYRVPVLGGEPVAVTANVSGIAFAPDGRQFAFFRIDPSNKASTLMVAHADGGGERKVETRRLPRYFSRYSLAWSPDGRWIACFAGNATSSGPEAFRLIAVRIADGVEKTISSRPWRWGGSLVWPVNGNSLLFDATENIEDGYQIWAASIENGEISRLTNDLNDYTRLSLTSDAKTMLAVQTQQSTEVWVAPAGDSSREAQITFGNLRGVESIAWTPDGRIVYSAQGGDYRNIWIMDADGRNSKQLTAGRGDKVEAAVTRDGKYIVYQLDGKVWRANIGGGNALQLTHGVMDVHPDSSADSKSVIYASFTDWSPGLAGKPTLWKVSIEGGKAVQLSSAPASVPKVSPDGKLIAFEYFPGGDPQLSPQLVGLMSAEGGSPIKVLDRLPSVASGVFWAPDGKALQFGVLNQHVGNIWRESLNGGLPAQITRFNTGQLFTFAWSQDGRQLAVARGKVVRDVVLITNFN